MKVIVPDYYKEFKCIAGACKDTCCAGWEVDVDEDSYQRYKQTGGSIGDRLKAVMLPKSEGDGCSFRLMPDKRCPFLNEKNLCDIYTELGEDALCDTCTYFPRFVHDYGSCREMGPAPSCFTAAQLMVAKQEETRLVSYEDKSIPVQPNDICPEAFFMLQDFRNEIFENMWNEEGGSHLHKRLIKILNRTDAAKSELKEMLEDYEDDAYKAGDVEKNEEEGSTKQGNLENGLKKNHAETVCSNDKDGSTTEKDIISLWLKPFPGMEIINKDWIRLLEIHNEFCKVCGNIKEQEEVSREFEDTVSFACGAFKQLLFYYFFRYIPEAVTDGRLMCAVKTGIVAYLTVRKLCVAVYHKNGAITEDEMADIFHLYSRQIEHSDINFEHYRDAYDGSQEYKTEVIRQVLCGI